MEKNVFSQFVSNVQGNQERATNIILNNELLLLRSVDNIFRAAVLCVQIRIQIKSGSPIQEGQNSSVPDPWHFGVVPDPDLDPGIHASD